jgi:hypothetical protein
MTKLALNPDNIAQLHFTFELSEFHFLFFEHYFIHNYYNIENICEIGSAFPMLR